MGANKYIEASCKDCGHTWLKREDSVKFNWKGRCRTCSNKEVANRPEVLLKKSIDARKQVLEQGGIPNAVMFDGTHGGENHWNWSGGISFEPYSSEFNKKLKRKIRRRDGYTCQECGATEDNTNKNLSVHHIDYDKHNCDEHNLISLCRSCNSKANFNRDVWETHFNEKISIILGTKHLR